LAHLTQSPSTSQEWVADEDADAADDDDDHGDGDAHLTESIDSTRFILI